MRPAAATGFLLVVAGGLGVALWITREKAVAPLQVQPALLEGRPLLAAKLIKIKNDVEGVPIVFEGREGRFYMTDPVRDLASAARLLSIAQAYDSALLVQAYEGAAIDEKVLRETGLDRPRCVVEVVHEGKQPITVDIGLDGLTGLDVFVKKGGIVWRGGIALYTVLKATTSDLRERQLFETQLSQRPDQISLSRPLGDGKRERIVFDLQGSTPRIVEPILARGDGNALGSALSQILAIQIEGFLQGAPGPRPDPDFVIEITGGQTRPETVRLWKQSTGAILGQHEQRKIEFSAGYPRYREAFEMPLERLRSRILIPMIQDDRINRIEIDPGVGSKAVRLEPGLAGGGMRMALPVSSECDQGQVSRLLGALQELSAESFVDAPGDLASLGLDEKQGAFKLSVRSDLMPLPVTLLLGRDVGEFTWCKRADEGFVVQVKKGPVDVFREDWAKLCSKVVQKVSGAPFELVSERAGVKRVWKKSREDGEWREAGQREASEKASVAVEALSELTAKAAFDPDQVGGLPEPTTVELRSDAGDTLGTFRLYEKDGKVLVGTKRIQLLFEVKERDKQPLLELMR